MEAPPATATAPALEAEEAVPPPLPRPADAPTPEPEPEPEPEQAGDDADAPKQTAMQHVKASVAHRQEQMRDLPMCHQDGCCFSYDDEGIRKRFKEQIRGCVSTHKEEEKVGVMYFRAEDKGCSSFGRAHHVFESWLTFAVWFQVAVSVLWLLFGAATGMFKRYELAEVDDDSVGEAPWGWAWTFFWVIWVYMWSYTGFWAFATGNKLWMIIYNIENAFYFVYCFVLFIDMLSDAGDVGEMSTALESAGLESPYCCQGWIIILGLVIGARSLEPACPPTRSPVHLSRAV